MTPDTILSTYDAVAADWDRLRDRTLFERRHLDRMLTHAPGKRVLDLGCGTGRPIAQYLADRRCAVTGVDGAPGMIELFRRNVPDGAGDRRGHARARAWRGFRRDPRLGFLLPPVSGRPARDDAGLRRPCCAARAC
jgi:SAM-dependent methyltransferase